MKANTKSVLKSFIVVLLLGVIFSPLYMYFSHDVVRLAAEYPHREEQGIEIQNKKPNSWVSLKEISPFARWAIVLSEDWSFYQHEGIDVEQMKVALEEMVQEKRFRGASTITQQMVKNVFLSSSRTLWRKLHELILAQKVEKALTKDRILEIYLNVIEFGPEIYGIKAAAQHYFRKHPSALTPRESAFLAMLLPSPKRYYISYKNKKLTPFARTRVQAILGKMRLGKIISKERYENEKDSLMAWETR
jgi:monofunctional glycosyltransferase